jgi:LysR family transcriptional regulator, benzoate and cis,cis-muconate-responsive activator of ben and cat genes
MLELRHLRYFVAVAEELNFSRAAERLHMAQPPLSVAIRQLEQELDTQLFTRTTHDVRLTDAGRVFLDGARATLAELDRSVAEARRASSGELGQLRVAFSWGARFVTLPALGQAFRAGHPDVELLTEEMWNARMPDALRSGQIDLAVSLCPEVSGELAYETIRSEKVVALVPERHPRARDGEVALGALADDAFVLFPREFAPRLYEALVGICRRAGFEPTIRSESFHTSWELGVMGDVSGIALVPASVTRETPSGVVALELTEPADVVETAVVWRRDKSPATPTPSSDGSKTARCRATAPGRRSAWRSSAAGCRRAEPIAPEATRSAAGSHPRAVSRARPAPRPLPRRTPASSWR